MWHLAASALLLVAAFLALRWQAGAWRVAPAWVLAIDMLPIVLGTLLFAALTARPLLAALLVAALAGGLAGADAVKRAVLHEPVVFADRAELLELVRHPEFYLPFAGTFLVLGCAVGGLAVVAAVAWAVPALWTWSPWPGLVAMALVAASLVLPGRPPLLGWLARRYAALHPSGDPARDSARWGLLACLIIHATLAAAERPARRAAPPILRSPRGLRAGPVVVVQLESFFDPGRWDEDLSDLMPGLQACRADAAAWGRLAVPGWGANTIRTEFSALTGRGADALGLDRFNPYERFARTRVDSLAWRMQALGRRTICLHPFDLGFYGRDRVMPALGFERLIGPEAFPGARGFVDDATLARHAAALIAAEGPDLFLFVISVGNHGPWLHDRGPEDAVPLPPALRAIPEADPLRRYLGGLRRGDAVFPILTEALRVAPGRGLLLAYGDHQPSLPALFAAAGQGDTDTDYVLWEPRRTSAPRTEPTSVEALPQILLDQLSAP